MLFLHQQKIVFLCNTKTASSSIEAALRPWAGIALTASPALKHMSYRTFVQDVAPLIEWGHKLMRADYEVVCVMREPISWVHSWYRYRSRDELKYATDERREKYSGMMSFSDYVRLYCSNDPPATARIGTQVGMLLGEAGTIAVDRIFPYERLEGLQDYLSAAIGEGIELPTLNVSPPADLELDADAEALLRARLRKAIEIHGRLRPDGRLENRGVRRRKLRQRLSGIKLPRWADRLPGVRA